MPSAVIIGAGVFGAALADKLARDEWDVTLLDAGEPGHPRAESGGETRLIRALHGPDTFYTRSARRGLELWRELGDVLDERGVAWFARQDDGWEAAGEEVLRAEGIPVERVSPDDGRRLFPDLAVDDLAFVLYEPDAGVLRAADGVRALVRRATEAGARVVRGQALPAGAAVELTVDGANAPAGGIGKPAGGAEERAGGARTGPGARGELAEADVVVWACGAWLGRLFPELVKLRVTFQQLALFDAPSEWAVAPGWVDFDEAFYGHGLVEPFGVKAAADHDGPDVDPDTRSLDATPEGIERARGYLAHRFPALASVPLRGAPGCHYGLTADGEFLFDRHPEQPNVWLLGGGSGHGYKHGPALAEHVAAVLAGRAHPEPRFALGERRQSRSLRTAGALDARERGQAEPA